jgi:hypothetical protein
MLISPGSLKQCVYEKRINNQNMDRNFGNSLEKEVPINRYYENNNIRNYLGEMEVKEG